MSKSIPPLHPIAFVACSGTALPFLASVIRPKILFIIIFAIVKFGWYFTGVTTISSLELFTNTILFLIIPCLCKWHIKIGYTKHVLSICVCVCQPELFGLMVGIERDLYIYLT
jgi:hypothetical protein